MKTGGQIVMQALAEHGVSRIFCVAGESYLPVLDAALDYPGIEMVTCRQESGASFAAEAYGMMTGRPGVAMVTRGPGACNASIGVHAAKQSSSPLVMFVGLVSTQDVGKEAFQEFDLPQMFGSHTKWSAVIEHAEDLGATISKAMHIAVSGRPGPVVLGLPEDILSKSVKDEGVEVLPRKTLVPDSEALKKIGALLGAAEKPLVIVGGGGWSDQACRDLQHFAADNQLPVAASFRRQDILDNVHECYVGELGTGSNPALLEQVKAADLVLVLNARINEIMTQGYTLFGAAQKIVHVYPDAAVFGKAYAPVLALEADIEPVMKALRAQVSDTPRWAAWRTELRAAYERWTDIDAAAKSHWQGADMTQVFSTLRDALPEGSILTTDAGNFSGWCQRYIRYARGRGPRLLAPLSGAMGYAIPAAVSAALEYPEHTVLGVCGDGGFMMTGMELATAIQHGAKPIIMVCNNGMYGTIRMHQERDFPGRHSATTLMNPDFVKMAESYGAFAARVEDAADFAAVWNAALAADRLALIEISMDPQQITTRARI